MIGFSSGNWVSRPSTKAANFPNEIIKMNLYNSTLVNKDLLKMFRKSLKEKTVIDKNFMNATNSLLIYQKVSAK